MQNEPQRVSTAGQGPQESEGGGGWTTSVRRPGRLALMASLLLPASLLRLYAATDNFWLDEIFTYFLALSQVHSLSDVLFAIRVEHQPLVTLTFYLMGDQPDWFWYRLPQVVAGTGIVALAAWAGSRRMGFGALLAVAAMTAVSYPLVVYASEARGYAPASFFSLVMFLLIDAYGRRRNQALLPGFWLAAAAAVLYHPSAVCIFGALGIWSALREWRLGGSPRRIVRELALCYGVPLLFIAWFYLTVMRSWGSVGGDVLPLIRVMGETMASLLGLPQEAPFRWAALGLGGALTVSSLWMLARHVKSDIWIFYLSALLLMPALMLAASGRPYVYVRYFVVLFPFFYLMAGEAGDAAFREFKGMRVVRVAIVALCLLILAGQLLATARFLAVGRGGYLEAVTTMATETARPGVTVGGDHDFRNGLPVHFYSRYLPQDRTLVYLRPAAWPPAGPDWYLVHNTCSEPLTPRAAITVAGLPYRLVKSYPVLGLSGVGWHLYRNAAKF